MKALVKRLYRLLFPPIWLTILLSVLSAALLVYAFACEDAIEAVAYGSYLLSAYALAAVCMRIPAIWRRFKRFKQGNRYISIYTSDPELRVKLSLYISLTVNLLYALMQLYLGFTNRSVWFYTLAAYYALLAAMRSGLLKETRKKPLGSDLRSELERYRICGALLCGMNLILSGVVSYIVWQDRGFEYGFINTIAMAAYTFFTLTKAIISIIRYRRYKSPVMSASKAVSLAAALVSMLSLETAMLTAFGENESHLFRRIMTGSFGGAVCIFVLGMAAYMIVRSTKEINLLKKENCNGQHI